jgi:hypothetical protein
MEASVNRVQGFAGKTEAGWRDGVEVRADFELEFGGEGLKVDRCAMRGHGV